MYEIGHADKITIQVIQKIVSAKYYKKIMERLMMRIFFIHSSVLKPD